MSMLRRLLVAAVFLALLVAGWRLAGSNAQPVRVDYVLGISPEIALWKALVAAAGLGALGLALPLSFGWARARLEIRRYRKELRRRDRELSALRGDEGGKEQEAGGGGARRVGEGGSPTA